MTTTPQPGWYRDPAADAGYRWWDGSAWTDHTADHAYAPSPADTLVLGPVRRRSRVVRVLAWTVVVSLVLTTSAGALMLIWSGPRAAGGGQPESASSVGGQLDERARRAAIGPATIDLPGSPFKVSGDPHEVVGVLDAAFLAEATIHPRTAQHGGWTAMICLASVNARLADDLNLDQGSIATVHKLAGRIYGSGPTEVSDVEVAEHAVDGYGGVRVTARVHYQIPGLSSQYDDVTAILVRLDDGSVVAAFSSVPDDAGGEIRELAASSLASLRIE